MVVTSLMMQAMLVMMMMVMTKVASSGRCLEEVLVQVQAATAISFPPTRKSGRHSFSVSFPVIFWRVTRFLCLLWQ